MAEHNCRMREIQRDLLASVQRFTEILEIHQARRDEEPSDEELEKAILHFLEEFPRERKKIKWWLRCLQEKADLIDKNHKDGTIARVSSSSASAISGVLSIAGLALAPVTAGASLILTASSAGIGLAAGAASISVGMREHRIHSKEMRTIEKLIKNCEESLRKVLSFEKTGYRFKLRSGSSPTQKTSKDSIVNLNPIGLIQKMETFGQHVNALGNVKAFPAMANLAKKATTVGKGARNAIKGIDQVDELFKGTALAMSKGARMAGIAFSGVFLAMDIGFIVSDSAKLALGAKTEEAAKIRMWRNVYKTQVSMTDRNVREALLDQATVHKVQPSISHTSPPIPSSQSQAEGKGKAVANSLQMAFEVAPPIQLRVTLDGPHSQALAQGKASLGILCLPLQPQICPKDASLSASNHTEIANEETEKYPEIQGSSGGSKKILEKR